MKMKKSTEAEFKRTTIFQKLRILLSEDKVVFISGRMFILADRITTCQSSDGKKMNTNVTIAQNKNRTVYDLIIYVKNILILHQC